MAKADGISKKVNDLKNMKRRIDETEEQAKGLLEQAEALTKLIPGTKDDEIVQAIKKQVDGVTEKYDQVSDMLSGATGDTKKKSK